MGQVRPLFPERDVFLSDSEGSVKARRCAEILTIHTERLGYTKCSIDVVGSDEIDGSELERWRVSIERIK